MGMYFKEDKQISLFEFGKAAGLNLNLEFTMQVQQKKITTQGKESDRIVFVRTVAFLRMA